MPFYRYTAMDPAGLQVTGEVEEVSWEEAEARLQADGFLVEVLSESETKPIGRSNLLSDNDLVELVEQITSLIRSGVPLASGLRAAGHELLSLSLRSTFVELADRLDSGLDLDKAMAASGRRFPAQLQGLILAGTRSGRLADLLGEYVRGANLASELRRKFWATLAYPGIGLVLVLILDAFICTLAIKAIDSLIGSLSQFGVQPQGSTEHLVAIARFVTDHGLLILGGMLLVPIVFWLTLKFGASPATRRRVICSIPVVGPILRFISLTEFCHLLAMLIEAGLTLPDAFELAGASVKDAEMAEACRMMGQAVESGEPLSTAVRLWDAIPAGLGQLFRWSEAQRTLPEALHLAGDMFESRARTQSSFASSVLATFLLLLIVWWIGFAIATLYLPLINLIGRLSG